MRRRGWVKDILNNDIDVLARASVRHLLLAIPE